MALCNYINANVMYNGSPEWFALQHYKAKLQHNKLCHIHMYINSPRELPLCNIYILFYVNMSGYKTGLTR